MQYLIADILKPTSTIYAPEKYEALLANSPKPNQQLETCITLKAAGAPEATIPHLFSPAMQCGVDTVSAITLPLFCCSQIT